MAQLPATAAIEYMSPLVVEQELERERERKLERKRKLER